MMNDINYYDHKYINGKNHKFHLTTKLWSSNAIYDYKHNHM